MLKATCRSARATRAVWYSVVFMRLAVCTSMVWYTCGWNDIVTTREVVIIMIVNAEGGREWRARGSIAVACLYRYM